MLSFKSVKQVAAGIKLQFLSGQKSHEFTSRGTYWSTKEETPYAVKIPVSQAAFRLALPNKFTLCTLYA